MRDSDRSRNVVIARIMAAPVLLFVVAAHPTRSHAEVGSAHKSVKVCNAELAERAGEIEKAGESPAAFFHACWTHAEPGKPTPIEAKAKVEIRPDVALPARRARVAPRAERSVFTRRRETPIDEAPRERSPTYVERRPRDFSPPPPAPLPPVVADTADTLGRVLRASGLPPIEVPVLVPGTLRIVPVTIAPR